MDTMIEGPAWAQQGLDQREGRYPLAVEAPVLSMVATLMPGLSTLTQFARYYSLYWALSDLADREQLDASDCQRIVRRAELLLALVTHEVDGRAVVAHGVDAMLRGRAAGKPMWQLAELGPRSYSPRGWGFWSQYGGPSDALGTATTDGGALRAARHPCPPAVREMFSPLLAVAVAEGESDAPSGLLAGLRPLALGSRGTPDLDALSEVFTATRGGRHDPAEWTGDDLTRRSTLRILARSAILVPDASSRLDALRQAVAYGPAAVQDPVLAAEDRTQAWRGLLLRHRSVGAWRRLWAGLVDHVKDQGVASHTDLRDWIADRLPDHRVDHLELPPIVDGAGHPLAAEDALPDQFGHVHIDVATLMVGAQRRDTLSGAALVAFLGGRRAGRGTFLDPTWVARLVADHSGRSSRDLGGALVDDMVAQARRVALRKVRVQDGRLQMFSRLHERNGTYTAHFREGAGNVGLRVDQLAGIAEQLGLLGSQGGTPVTPLGANVLRVST